MRFQTLTKWLVVGGSAAAWLLHRRRHGSEHSSSATWVNEPDVVPTNEAETGEPVEGIDETGEVFVESREEEAQLLEEAEAEVAQDLATVEAEAPPSEEHLPPVADYETIEYRQADKKDAGDLYGAHTPHALDREIPDGDESFEEGANWLEALNTRAAELGPVEEEEVDVIDTAEQPPHPSDTKDEPIADKGSAGPRGL